MMTYETSVTALATRPAMTPRHLSRVCAAMTGETPAALLRRVRLAQAARRLRSSTKNVSDIAAAAGFASHEAFTRAFLRQYGLTPSAYRCARPLPAGKSGGPAMWRRLFAGALRSMSSDSQRRS